MGASEFGVRQAILPFTHIVRRDVAALVTTWAGRIYPPPCDSSPRPATAPFQARRATELSRSAQAPGSHRGGIFKSRKGRRGLRSPGKCALPVPSDDPAPFERRMRVSIWIIAWPPGASPYRACSYLQLPGAGAPRLSFVAPRRGSESLAGIRNQKPDAQARVNPPHPRCHQRGHGLHRRCG